MKKINFWLLTGFVSVLVCSGFSQEKIPQQTEKEHQDYITATNKDLENYIRKRDREYADYLKKSWGEVTLSEALQPDTTPMPMTIPEFDPNRQKKPDSRLILTLPQVIRQTNEKLQIPWIPVIVKPVPEHSFQDKISFLFYGSQVTFNYDPGIRVPVPAGISGAAIARYWEEVSASNYPGLLNALLNEKNEMQLNDWGFLQLVRSAAKELNPGSENGMNLLSWYLLTKAGYKIRLAYKGNEIFLLMPSVSRLYGIRYFNSGRINYYLIGSKQDSEISTYDKDFPDALKIFDLNIRNALNLGETTNEVTVSFTFDGRPYAVPFRFNMNSIQFYRDYPPCDIRICFDAAVSKAFKESVLEKLRPLVEGKNRNESTAFLLKLVQNGFVYSADKVQPNGRRKFNFPEETLFYPFSDCGDRAVFFAYLARELLGLKVIGVEYPGYWATAICFNEEIPGDFILWKGKKYIIADPTYVTAPPGLIMPKYARSKAGIIELGATLTTCAERDTTWNRTMACGGKPGDNRQNIATDADGNSYVAGYYNPRAVFGSITLASPNGYNEAFIAKLDKQGQWTWAKKAGGKNNDLAYNIAIGPDTNIYVAGSFSGAISFGTVNLKAQGHPDLFLARYDRNGNLLWANRAGLDTLSSGKDFLYTVSFSAKGKHLLMKTFPADTVFTDRGISFDQDGDVYYTSSYAESPGFIIKPPPLLAKEDFNIVDSLKTGTDKLIAVHYEKTIAGFFAFINLLRTDTGKIYGKIVREALESYNPEFRNTAPRLYQNIGKIRVIRNNDGMVIIKTDDARPVYFGKVKINDDARIKIVPLPGDDVRIDVLSGIRYGKAHTWYNLNSVRLSSFTGNLLFDYDDDHTRESVNVSRDILN